MPDAEQKFEVALTLLKYGDKYIFQHRDDIPNIASPGLFAGFGGKIEPDEDPLTAATRELAEETSLPANQLNYKELGTVDLPGIKGGRRYIFLAEIETDNFDVYEGQGSVAFTLNELSSIDLKRFAPTTAQAIQKWLLKVK